MPLHLLGKKSWNVYNRENIARVRRDEALAKAREEESERREQEKITEKRIQLLRGAHESSPPSESRHPAHDDSAVAPAREKRGHGDSRHRKRRRLAGENDTDRDIRLAKEDVQQADVRRDGDAAVRKAQSDAPILDASGHISLFPPEKPEKSRNEKHPEAEAEKARKERELEDQYTMRFSNAAGFKQGLKQPWYSSSKQDLAVQSASIPSKDVWGNEDPRRRERERLRVNANDPLAAMKKGVRQLREVETARKKWNDERQRELQALRREQEGSRRRRRRRSAESADSLENFKLDDDTQHNEEQHRKHRSRRHHREDRDRRSKQSRTDCDRRSRGSEAKRKRSRSPDLQR